MVVAHAAREFDHREFRAEDRARVAQAKDDRAVVVEVLIFVRGRAPSGRRIVRGEQVFHAERNAVQRPAPASGFHLALGRARRLQRALAHDGDDRAEAWAVLFEPREIAFRQLDGRELARAQLRAQL